MLGPLTEFLFPPACMACHAPIGPRLSGEGSSLGARTLLCVECNLLLRPLDPDCACTHCGAYPFRTDDAKTPPGFCIECDVLPRSFVEARSAFPYDGPAGGMVRNMKYQHSPYLAPRLVELAGEVVGDWLEREVPLAVLAPVPMALRREFFRGYNQARELAIALADRYGAQVLDDDALIRARWRGPQARHHHHSERLDNLRGSFSVRDRSSVAGGRFIVVDDVMTSGATAAFAAEALVAAGASEVRLFAVVRASLGEGDRAMLEVTAS